jgi:hypothetical protein
MIERNIPIPIHFLESRSPENIIHYYVQYFGKTKTGNLCGINFNTTKNPKVQALANKIYKHFFEQIKLPFCEEANDIVSTFCELKTYCIEKDKENEPDLLFALLYASFQMYQNHTDAFICKDKQGKVTIGEIVNPAAYTTDFDVFKQPILITPLPCPSKGALFLSQIFGRNNLVSSHQLASTPQGPQNVLNNIQDYFDKTKNNGTICGIGLIHQSDPTIKKLLDDLHKFRMNHTGCFCRRTFTEILPVLGKLRTHCTVNPFEINFVFGLYYVDNQLYRKHSTPFSCKDKKGKELLGEIIQPAAYLPNYDLTKNPLLTRPLPCNNTIEEIECSATEEIGQIRSENDDDPIQLEVFKKLFEKFQH